MPMPNYNTFGNSLLSVNQFPAQTLIPSPFSGQNAAPVQQVALLNLTQIEGFEPVRKFTDETNTEWQLVKAYSDSTVDVPDPKGMQIVDYWDHRFIGLKEDVPLFVYCVEGIRQPRVDTEQPSRIMYQWFSKMYVRDFNPQMVSEQEWRKANVYAAPVVNARVSKLNAFCHANATALAAQEPAKEELIRVEGLSDGHS